MSFWSKRRARREEKARQAQADLEAAYMEMWDAMFKTMVGRTDERTKSNE